jgi:hypothetical protein
MAGVILNGSTSGSVTLDAPAVSGSTVITLPTTSGTMATLTTPSFTTTIGVGAATPSASGAGITFPATQSASTNANTLDDYEEGTYTITATPTTSGTITGTSDRDAGVYTKIGRLVTVYGLFEIASSSSPVGTGIRISLPFPIAATPEYSQYWATASSIYQISGTSTVIVSDSAGGGTSYFQFTKAANTIANNGQFKFSFIYFTD